MSAETLLSRLSKVRRTGQGRWIACCPAHEDRSPSLAVKETPDTIAIHCFGGCSTEEVLSAVGMTFSDLYPNHNRTVKPGRIPASDALACIAMESLVAAAAAATMRQRDLTANEIERLMTASSRINAALTLAGIR